jgi:hypothetical protein
MISRIKKLALAGAMSLGLLATISVGYVAKAAQGTGCLPTTGTVSGLTFAQGVNAAIAALISGNSGASPPSTDCSAAPVKGQVWLDTSVTPNVMKQYDGTSWVLLGAVDASNHLWAPPVGGGAATIASAAGVTDIWANSASSITISGTNTITALANASAVPGTVKVVTAGGTFTMTHNATSLELPSGANITVVAGDRFLAVAKSTTNVAVFAYTKADGSAITNPSVPIGTQLFGMWGTIPAKTLYGAGQPISRSAYPDYLNAMTRVQTGTLTAGNTTITSLSNTDGFGPGMPIEGVGIQSGTTIVSVTASTIAMSASATANGSQNIRVFITGYGSGGDSTTIGVADCKGRSIAGRDNMGGTAAGRLTGASGFNTSQLNTSGGLESRGIAQGNLPVATLATTIVDPGHVHTGVLNNNLNGNTTYTQAQTPAPGSGYGYLNVSIGTAPIFTTPSAQTGITASTQLGGSGAAFPIVQPTLIAECVVVVLP